jgi:hypothetical protein
VVSRSYTAVIDSSHSVAGSDTSATGIRATMLNIMSNPRVYAKLTAEIDAAMRSGKIPTDSNAVISDTQAKELPYLQACIKEVTRPNFSVCNIHLIVDAGFAVVSSHCRSPCQRGRAANPHVPSRKLRG